MSEKVLSVPFEFLETFYQNYDLKNIMEEKEIVLFVNRDKEKEVYRNFIDFFSTKFSFQPRDKVEHDRYYKQIIPYILILGNNNTEVFSYERSINAGEERLHNLKSIGIGGHINYEDNKNLSDDLHEIIKSGMKRELNEEVEISNPKFNIDMRFIGFINTNRDEVGEHHLAMIYTVSIPKECNVRLIDKKYKNQKWFNINDKPDNIDEFETWSRIILNLLNEY